MIEPASEVAFSYLTEDVLKEFQGIGSDSLIQLIESPDNSPAEADELIGTIFTEIIMAIEEETLDADKVMGFLSMCIKSEEVAEKFCQVLNIFPSSAAIENFIRKLHANQKVIRPLTIAKFVSLETLGKLGSIPLDIATRQLNTRKRDEFYTQRKYNLLYEEPEGFARIIVEIFGILQSNGSTYQVDYAVKTIEKIVGHYNLDPSKVFDIVFDCCSNLLVNNSDFIIEFFKKSRWWPSKPSINSSLDTLSEGGNKNLAKVLGLKLLRQAGEKTPETLKLHVAILIKEGMVSFGDIYKFLGPDEQEMNDLEKLYKKELDDQVFKSSANALALAAPLMDDEDEDSSKTSSSDNTKSSLPAAKSLKDQLKTNLKYQMLKAFLGIGLYWPAVYILTEYPFLALVDEDVGQLISRLYHQIIDPLYQKTAVGFSPEELKILLKAKPNAISRPNNEVYYSTVQVKTFLNFNATMKDYGVKRFVYFYKNWTRGLPEVNTTEDLFVACKGLLRFLGVKMATDVQLYIKICEIGDQDLSQSKLVDEWFSFYRNILFPAISILDSNSIAVDKAYKILSHYSREERFNLYSEFHQVTSKSNPFIRMSYGKAEKSTKDVLKRLSKETVRPMMRRIAKISFANPLPCFLTILQQIESYDNLNNLVVETARYFNSYGWDVLPLAIMIRVTASGRSSIQTNGLFERQWIQSLASFVGKICQKYPNSIDIAVLLDFIIKSLHSNDSSVLSIFKEMLLSMGGITSINNLTLDQIYKLNSGDSLKKLVYSTIQDTRFDNLKPGTVFVQKMIETNSINEILVLLSQLNVNLEHEDDSLHLKLLANRKDEITAVLQLFCDLINFFAKLDNFSDNLVPVSELIEKYNVPPEWAFEPWRKHINNTPITIKEEFSISQDLFGSFWKLSLYDIYYDEQSYTTALEKFKTTSTTLESAYNRSKRGNSPKHEIEEKLKALKSNNRYLETIPQDQKLHKERFEEVNSQVFGNIAQWFNNQLEQKIKDLLQYCILPRAVHSSYDAVYAAKFIFKLCNSDVTFIFTLIFDQLIKKALLLGSFFTSTLAESENLGIFYLEILQTLENWLKEETYSQMEYPPTKQSGESYSYSEFKSLVYGYHSSLLADMSRALRLNDYMCRRNGIIFLKNIIGLFPVVEDQCDSLVEIIEYIITYEEREDLKLSANALIGHIKSRKDKWVHLWDFIDMDEKDAEYHKSVRQETLDKIQKEEQEKREIQRKAREEREKVDRERQEKIKRENSEAEKAALLKEKEKLKLNYSGTSTKSTAVPRESRKEDTDKRRHIYSKYEQNKPLSYNNKPSEKFKELPKRPNAPTGPSAISNKAPTKPADTRLNDRNKRPRPDERSLYVPSHSQAQNRAKPAEPARKREPLTPQLQLTKEARKREPLAPQLQLTKEALTKKHGSFDRKYDRNSTYNTFDNRKPARATYDNRRPESLNQQSSQRPQSGGTTQKSNSQLPLPPPPPPPPAGPREKRKYDYQGNSRSYDKRQRYQ